MQNIENTYLIKSLMITSKKNNTVNKYDRLKCQDEQDLFHVEHFINQIIIFH